MRKFTELVRNEYRNEYTMKKAKDYTEPKVYDAGGDLSKRWYVYYSVRNPETDRLERQPPLGYV
ncbi:hypothetical protein SAMN05444369_102235 [Capnocytophaga haemolytica]|uniref:Uncharacterized protein n=1 Tax=Capnocytophaga haemolytica TaxID=45243 RepID=A0AAX2GXA4_9FLAO|nr:hypothetical protein AXF12_04915 [Capnocytophaga haemolytica]SFN78169.1 hypothetical protein SAMN05444369_102235 [Capnocytophaga haemolytica]SNV06451.1 Uncharacterised protein [Capnocytophaga haemolytica]